MNGKSDDANAFNAYLDTLQQKIFEAKRQLIETDKELTASSIDSFENWISKKYDYAFIDFKKYNLNNSKMYADFYMSGLVKGNMFHTYKLSAME